jgi:Secretion system C-terminal sorting domain
MITCLKYKSLLLNYPIFYSIKKEKEMKPFTIKSVLLLFAACMLAGLAMGQSTGDICMIGANADNPDIILMVTLVPVPGSTDIYFSDNEWNGSAWADLNEGIKKYTTPGGGLEAGDVVELDFTNNTATVGTLASESGSFALGTSGDQFYMYLGTATSPSTFLFAITLYGVWGAGELTNTGLTSSVDALIFASSTDNVRYDGTRTGTVAELKTAIADETTNWGTSLDPYTFSTTAFTVSEVPLPITLSSFTATAVNGAVELAWETATETNNANFVIYRNDVAIASVAGAGTITEPHSYSYVDDAVVPGVTYTYILADVDYANVETKYEDDAVTVTVANDLVEADFVVGAAYPNPFNPTAVVPIELSRDAMVKASLYDLNGREVKALINANFTAGTHDLRIDGAGLTTGLYLLQVVVDNVVDVQKIALMK